MQTETGADGDADRRKRSQNRRRTKPCTDFLFGSSSNVEVATDDSLFSSYRCSESCCRVLREWFKPLRGDHLGGGVARSCPSHMPTVCRCALPVRPSRPFVRFLPQRTSACFFSSLSWSGFVQSPFRVECLCFLFLLILRACLSVQFLFNFFLSP